MKAEKIRNKTQQFYKGLRDACTGCPERLLEPAEQKVHMIHCKCCGRAIDQQQSGAFPHGGAVCWKCYDKANTPCSAEAARCYAQMRATEFFPWVWANLTEQEKWQVEHHGYEGLDTQTKQELETDFLDNAAERHDFLLIWAATNQNTQKAEKQTICLV